MDSPLQYEIRYSSENIYLGSPEEAHLQFLIIPENNPTQKVITSRFENSLMAEPQISINGLGFQTLRLHIRMMSEKLWFSAHFFLEKSYENPFNFDPAMAGGPEDLQNSEFKASYASYLSHGTYTRITKQAPGLFTFDDSLSIFENLKRLNTWCNKYLQYSLDITNTQTTVSDLLMNPQGVCQDYAHLFCALARTHGIPVRYVSGYLNQGAGLEGSSQLHAWVEAMIPGIGWLGFDPTNDLLVNEHYIKICHGRNYLDCAPLKGIILGPGTNQTNHSVQVSAQQ